LGKFTENNESSTSHILYLCANFVADNHAFNY